MFFRTDNLPFAVGALLSSIALFGGLAGSFFTAPRLVKWWEGADWRPAPGVILSGDLRYTISVRGGSTVRPHFTWSYSKDGRSYRGEGYGFAEVSTASVNAAVLTLADYPPGKEIDVLVNPENPAESALARERPGQLFVLMVPPLFAVFGLVGVFFTATGKLGWYAAGTRNPVGKAGRAVLAFLTKPKVIMALLAAGITAAFVALLADTLRTGSAAGALIAVFMAWALFRVYRIAKSRR